MPSVKGRDRLTCPRAYAAKRYLLVELRVILNLWEVTQLMLKLHCSLRSSWQCLKLGDTWGQFLFLPLKPCSFYTHCSWHAYLFSFLPCKFFHSSCKVTHQIPSCFFNNTSFITVSWIWVIESWLAAYLKESFKEGRTCRAVCYCL